MPKYLKYLNPVRCLLSKRGKHLNPARFAMALGKFLKEFMAFDLPSLCQNPNEKVF